MTINQRSRVRRFDDLRCVEKKWKTFPYTLYMVLRMWYNWCVAILWVMRKTSWWCVKHHEMTIKFDLWQLRVSDFWENWLMVLEVWTLLLKAKISLVGIKPSSMVICLVEREVKTVRSCYASHPIVMSFNLGSRDWTICDLDCGFNNGENRRRSHKPSVFD